VETELSKREESKLAALSTEAWLMALRKYLSEVEDDTEEAYLHRRELVKLLVEDYRGPRRGRPGKGGYHLSVRPTRSPARGG
jgi:hypothetical protein